MNTALDCVPCLVRQTLDAARLVSDDPKIHEEALRFTLGFLSHSSFDRTPPALAGEIHGELKRVLNDQDPYKAQKQRFNQLALDMRPELAQSVREAADPLERALHLAIAGNVVDFGVTANINEAHLHQAIEQAAAQPLIGDYRTFQTRIAEADRILFLADNTGEIVFDALLIEQLPTDKLTVAVRGQPIINDATLIDAELAGITDLVPVISNGAALPGTDLSFTSEEFMTHFNAADLIISKGQGNFEGLSDVKDKRIAFLFRVKCDLVSRLAGYPVGSHVLLCSAA